MPFRTAIRLASLPLGHALLNRDRAFHGVDGARELNQGTVAHQLHDAAVVLGDQWLEALLAARLHARDRAGFVVPNQPAVANHVRGQNRPRASYPCGEPWRHPPRN